MQGRDLVFLLLVLEQPLDRQFVKMYLNKKTAHMQQHAQIKENYTAKSPCSWSEHLPAPLHFPPPVPARWLPAAEPGRGQALEEGGWRAGRRTMQRRALGQAAGLQHELALQLLGQLLRQEGSLKLPGAGTVLRPVGHRVADVADLNSKGIFVACAKRNCHRLGWIGRRLAKLPSISEGRQILQAGQQQFLGNLRTDAFLHVYTGTNHTLADMELLRSV